MPRPRLALVTSLWPLPGEPHGGKPIYETALRLLAWADVRVFCPSPRYPPLRWLQPARYVYHRPDAAYAPPGLSTTYLEYRTVPLVGRSWNGMAMNRAIGPELRAWRADVILAYWIYPTGWAAVRAGRRMGVPVVVGARGSDLHRIPGVLERRMTSSALRQAAAVLTVTEDLKRRAVALGADPGRTHSIPNGCDSTLYRPMPLADARDALGLPRQGRLALQIGHLIPSKGIFDLWDAFAGIARECPDLRLVLIGEGPGAEDLRARASASGFADRLLLPGPRPPAEIVLWLNAADIVCLASHGEGCPNVILEALACGRPVVGCDVGGIPELVRPDCGLLAPRFNPPVFGQAMREALMRTWDTGWISSHFRRTWEDVAAETYRVCGTLLRTERIA